MTARRWLGAALLVFGGAAAGCAHAPEVGTTVSVSPSLAEAESLSVVPLDAPPKLFFKNVSPASMGADLKTQPTPTLPEDVRRRANSSELSGTYVVGVDLDGHVSRIDVVESLPGGDNTIIATIQKWKFQPQEQRVRFLQRFVFSVSGHP
jgi:hypothetical protein